MGVIGHVSTKNPNYIYIFVGLTLMLCHRENVYKPTKKPIKIIVDPAGIDLTTIYMVLYHLTHSILLIHLVHVVHICVSELGYYWFRLRISPVNTKLLPKSGPSYSIGTIGLNCNRLWIEI